VYLEPPKCSITSGLPPKCFPVHAAGPESEEEKQELWNLIDEIVHHRVIKFFLDNLDSSHHPQFLENYFEKPHDEVHIEYLKEKVGDHIHENLTIHVKEIEKDLLTQFE
jgi:hypothetical protein